LSVDHTVLKLGDFGLARATEGTRQTKTQIGSYRYMAPEVVTSGGRYSKKADVHSYGESMAIVTVSATGKVSFFRLFLFYVFPEDTKPRTIIVIIFYNLVYVYYIGSLWIAVFFSCLYKTEGVPLLKERFLI